MKVIFLQDVPRVGKRHDIKNVSDGYASNFLLPKKLVVVATPKAIAELEARKKEVVIKKEIQEDLLIKNLEEIKGKIITIKQKADDKGHLFAAVHKKEIVEAMQAEHHANISEDSIQLPKPLKELGEFEIPISVKGKTSSFKLKIDRI